MRYTCNITRRRVRIRASHHMAVDYTLQLCGSILLYNHNQVWSITCYDNVLCIHYPSHTMHLNLKDSIVESSRLNITMKCLYYVYIIVSITLHINRIFIVSLWRVWLRRIFSSGNNVGYLKRNICSDFLHNFYLNSSTLLEQSARYQEHPFSCEAPDISVRF
jgi:hypothetical protein